jgi:undecaprenyl-diphosphatase
VATSVTRILGLALTFIIEKVFMHGQAKAEVEELFSYLPLIGGALLAAGLLILFSGSTEEKWPASGRVDLVKAAVIGAVQGFCLPFRGFSRSGGTISAGLLLGIERRQIEEFSFALAVVLTPIVVVMELWRLIKAHPEMTHGPALMKLLEPGLVGMVCSFVAGYLALKLLSRLLEAGRWKYFGYYCLVASLVVFALAYAEPAGAASPAFVPDAGQTPAATVASPGNLPPAPLPVLNTTSPATMLPASAQPSTNPMAMPTTNSAPVSP